MDIQGFLYRRLSRFITCTFNLNSNKRVKLYDKQHIASFQDVFVNPFYTDCLSQLEYEPLVIMDLGANLGFFSVLCSNFFEYKASAVKPEFILVEANPYILPALNKNLQNFKINNYQVINGVIGPKEKHVSFYVNKQLSMSSSAITKDANSKQINIPTIDLDDFFSVNKVDLIKIDIEGSEYELFDNYFDAITRVKTIVVEFHSDDKTGAVINRLIANNYKIVISTREKQSGLQLVMLVKQ